MSAEDDEVVSRATARLGVVLKGKYTLDRILGVGGMATVYSATHRNGKAFAVKVLHADLSLRSDTRTRFLREGYLANRVNHPGAVAVLDDDVAEDGGAFLVMELVHGETLETLWERNGGRLPLAFVAGIGLQLLDVLAAAHARGLIHRDIKPGNLMVTHEGVVKVLDFGIARLRDVAAARTTQTGMVMGTPAFMAPEHALAQTDEVDARTDVWEAGATLFTLVTGQLVHDGANAQQILVKAATARARPLAAVMPGAPPAICAVIDRALAFEKSERWPGASAMREALREASSVALIAVPTAAVIAALLEDLGQHEKTRVVAAVEPPPDSAVVERDSGEMATGQRPAPPPSAGSSGTLVSSHQGPKRLEARGPALAGPITAEAVASDSSILRGMTKPRGIMAIVLGTLGLGAVLLVVIRTGRAKDATPIAPTTQAVVVVPAAPTTSVVAPPTVPPPVATPAWTAVPTPPAEPAVIESSAVTPRPKPVMPVAPAPPVAVTAPTAKASAAAPSCNPPYEFDEKGNKRWKRQCL
jgi:serine/threonine protein kinase